MSTKKIMFSFQISPGIVDEIEELAALSDVNRSEMARQLIKKGLASDVSLEATLARLEEELEEERARIDKQKAKHVSRLQEFKEIRAKLAERAERAEKLEAEEAWHQAIEEEHRIADAKELENKPMLRRIVGGDQ